MPLFPAQRMTAFLSVQQNSIATEASLIETLDKVKVGSEKQTGRPLRPSDLFGEFVHIRDALNVANGVGGVKVMRSLNICGPQKCRDGRCFLLHCVVEYCVCARGM